MNIDEREVLTTLEELIAFPSVTGDEGPIGEALAKTLGRLGLEVEVQQVEDGRSNVIGRLKGGDGPSLVLMGHMDVVPPGSGWRTDPFKAHIDGGRLYGRGSCDMKGGLAAIIGAVSSLVREARPPAGDVIVAAVIGEEEDLSGSQALIDGGFSADMAIIAEPTSLSIVRAHKGAVVYSLDIEGVAVHASVPEVGRNAIETAVDLVLELRREVEANRRHSHPVLGKGTINVGVIKGGTRPHIVPAECTIEVDRRILPGETLETVEAEVWSAVEGARRKWSTISVDFLPAVEALAFEVPADHPLVALAVDAARQVGLPGEVGALPGVSDASVIANKGGIPTVLVGPGSVREAAHQANEFVPISEVMSAARFFREAALVAGSAGREHFADR